MQYVEATSAVQGGPGFITVYSELDLKLKRQGGCSHGEPRGVAIAAKRVLEIAKTIPDFDIDGIWANTIGMGEGHLNTDETFAHELGHLLGLPHTHDDRALAGENVDDTDHLMKPGVNRDSGDTDLLGSNGSIIYKTACEILE